MLLFPTLSTGSVAQYPLPISYILPAEVIRFIDGSDQRFIARGRPLRSWRIHLSSLNDQEAVRLQQFFETVQGQFSPFIFADPYSGTSVPNCVLGQNSMMTDYLSTDITAASIWVVETNG